MLSVWLLDFEGLADVRDLQLVVSLSDVELNDRCRYVKLSRLGGDLQCGVCGLDYGAGLVLSGITVVSPVSNTIVVKSGSATSHSLRS